MKEIRIVMCVCVIHMRGVASRQELFIFNQIVERMKSVRYLQRQLKWL